MVGDRTMVRDPLPHLLCCKVSPWSNKKLRAIPYRWVKHFESPQRVVLSEAQNAGKGKPIPRICVYSWGWTAGPSRIKGAQYSQFLLQSLLLAGGHSAVAVLVNGNQQCLFPAWFLSPLLQPLDSWQHWGSWWQGLAVSQLARSFCLFGCLVSLL